ncbi:MAG: aminotransferase class V-fold PLP-dependent enzyme [Longimicrobiales bacterium]
MRRNAQTSSTASMVAPFATGCTSRRTFIGTMVGGALAPAVLPVLPSPVQAHAARAERAVPTLDRESQASEEYWEIIRSQFPLRAELIVLNAANLCPSPRIVSDAVAVYTRDIDADPSFQNRAKFSGLHQKTIERVAAWVGADADEIAITRNTSESNNIVVGGLDMGSGDEVVLWDENHPTNNVAWDVRAQRYGFTVRRVKRPDAPASAAPDLVQPFLDALGPRTRVLAFSHASNSSGVLLPAAELCAAARQRGILTLVDGAQTFGALDLDLHAMGCDFFTASAHKWLMGPKEAGLLYVRRGSGERLWPGVVGVGWEGAKAAGARRFSTLGQRDDAAIVAVGAAVEFLERIGAARVEARVRQLATTLKQNIADAVPGVRFVTPLDPASSAGVVIFAVEGIDTRAAYNRLYEQYSIAGASTGGIRLCPHVYNTMAQMERVVEAVRQVTAV